MSKKQQITSSGQENFKITCNRVEKPQFVRVMDMICVRFIYGLVTTLPVGFVLPVLTLTTNIKKKGWGKEARQCNNVS